MMSIQDIKDVAARYADFMIKDETEFLDAFDAEKEKYNVSECLAIQKLTDVYYNCKTGRISRDEAVKKQNEILKGV